VSLGQQVDLPVTAVLQHGDAELADKLACGQGFQLLVEADREHLPDHRRTVIGGRGKAQVGGVVAVGHKVEVAQASPRRRRERLDGLKQRLHFVLLTMRWWSGRGLAAHRDNQLLAAAVPGRLAVCRQWFNLQAQVLGVE
jgi:hypothetical protein